MTGRRERWMKEETQGDTTKIKGHLGGYGNLIECKNFLKYMHIQKLSNCNHQIIRETHPSGHLLPLPVVSK